MNASFAKSKFSDSGPQGGLCANSPPAPRTLSDFAGGLLAHKPSELLGAAASPRSAEIGRTEAAGAAHYLTKYHFSVLSKKCTDVSKSKNGAKHTDLCI